MTLARRLLGLALWHLGQALTQPTVSRMDAHQMAAIRWPEEPRSESDEHRSA